MNPIEGEESSGFFAEAEPPPTRPTRARPAKKPVATPVETPAEPLDKLIAPRAKLIHLDFPSQILGQMRKIVIYLPPGYSAQDPWKYPVVYAQDGQNIFNPRTAAFGVDWAMHEAADGAIAGQRMRPLVIVAIYNSKLRFDEYTPTSDPRHKGGKAAQYMRFLIEELKPYVDRTYHISPRAEDTCILGSSLGGLLALHGGWRHPDVFGAVAAMSPSLWWAGRDIITAIGGSPRRKSPGRIYIDVGTRESNDDHNQNGVADVLDDLRTLRAVLLYHGYELGENLWYEEVNGAAHTESDWAARVGKVLETLFPAKPADPGLVLSKAQSHIL